MIGAADHVLDFGPGAGTSGGEVVATPTMGGSLPLYLFDEILGVPFPVLDDGHVRVVDYMGDDAAVVQAARVSYGRGTKRVREDRGLIRYLMRHWHSTPFEMCEVKLHVKLPVFVARQWIRHRTANVNEYSTRYSIAIDRARSSIGAPWPAKRFESTKARSASWIRPSATSTGRAASSAASVPMPSSAIMALLPRATDRPSTVP